MTRKPAPTNDLEAPEQDENGPDRTRLLKPRLRQLLDVLPQCDWVISRAAQELGYSKTYAEQRLPALLRANVAFCQAMEAKRQEFIAATGWDEKKWRQECVGQFERAKADKDWPAICALLRMLGNNTGALHANLHPPTPPGGVVVLVFGGQPGQQGVKQIESKPVEALAASAGDESDGSK